MKGNEYTMELSVNRGGDAYVSTLLGLIRNRLDRVSRDPRRRKVRRRLGDDPTTAIGSPRDAINIAETLLEPVSRKDANHALWANAAVGPLAELVYAASKQRNVCGIKWTWHALVNVDADATVPGWRQAADIWDQAGAPLPGQLLYVAGLPSRQRHSVVLMMHAAIAPWLPAGQR